MSSARLILKQPTGWFAAGREAAQALTELSDAGCNGPQKLDTKKAFS